jgi:uncharacterized protein
MFGHLNIEESEILLKDNHFGHIGCNDGYNTFVYPTNYVFDGKYIFCHSLAGSKTMVMQQHNRVCLQVEQIRDPNNWKSVMVLGNYYELDNERDRLYAMKLFNNCHLHPKVNDDIARKTSAEHNQLHLPQKSRPVIYRISIDEVSGRFESITS